MKFWRTLGIVVVTLFALVGLAFTGVFVAMQFGLLNVRGSSSERNASFFRGVTKTGYSLKTADSSNAVTLCKIHALANYAPETARNIQVVHETKQDPSLTARMLSTAQIRFMPQGIEKDFSDCARVTVPDTTPIVQTAYAWADSDEWRVIKSAFVRDQDIIRKAAEDAGISPRLLLGGVIGEQFRFFTNSRESFKRYFEPLKILASLSQFSFGIAGFKPETAKRIDEQLKNPSSVFYLGPDKEQVITYPDGSDEEAVRFERITDTKNPYYSYLYVGLFMKQVIQQWKASGYDISNRPDVLSTLYNLGFNRSIPKPYPSAGGAPITVNGTLYNFGELGEQFYYSGELIQEFPY